MADNLKSPPITGKGGYNLDSLPQEAFSATAQGKQTSTSPAVAGKSSYQLDNLPAAAFPSSAPPVETQSATVGSYDLSSLPDDAFRHNVDDASTSGTSTVFSEEEIEEKLQSKSPTVRKKAYEAISNYVANGKMATTNLLKNNTILTQMVSESNALTLEAAILCIAKACSSTDSKCLPAKVPISMIKKAVEKTFNVNKPAIVTDAMQLVVELIRRCDDQPQCVRYLLDTTRSSKKKKLPPPCCRCLALLIEKIPEAFDISILQQMLPTLLMTTEKNLASAALAFAQTACRKWPEEFREMLDKFSDKLSSHVQEVLREEIGHSTQNESNANVQDKSRSHEGVPGEEFAPIFAEAVTEPLRPLLACIFAKNDSYDEDAPVPILKDFNKLGIDAALKEKKWKLRADALQSGIALLSKTKKIAETSSELRVIREVAKSACSDSIMQVNLLGLQMLAWLALKSRERFRIASKNLQGDIWEKLKDKKIQVATNSSVMLLAFIKCCLNFDDFSDHIKTNLHSLSKEARQRTVWLVKTLVAYPAVIPDAALNDDVIMGIATHLKTASQDQDAQVKNEAEVALGELIRRLSSDEASGSTHTALAPILEDIRNENEKCFNRIMYHSGDTAAAMMTEADLGLLVKKSTVSVTAARPPAPPVQAEPEAPQQLQKRKKKTSRPLHSNASKRGPRTGGNSAETVNSSNDNKTNDPQTLPTTPAVGDLPNGDDAMAMLANIEGIDLSGIGSDKWQDKCEAIAAIACSLRRTGNCGGNTADAMISFFMASTSNFKQLSNANLLKAYAKAIAETACASVGVKDIPESLLGSERTRQIVSELDHASVNNPITPMSWTACHAVIQSAFADKMKEPPNRGGTDVTLMMDSFSFVWGPDLVCKQLMSRLSSSKLPTLQAALNKFLVHSVEAFGSHRLTTLMRDIVQRCLSSSGGLRSTNLAVKSSASSLLQALHVQQGEIIISLAEQEATKQNVDSRLLNPVLESMTANSASQPSQFLPVRLEVDRVTTEKDKTCPNSKPQAIDFSNSVRDIVSPAILNDLNTLDHSTCRDDDDRKPWQIRRDALEQVISAVQQAEKLGLEWDDKCSQLIALLTGRLSDSNANLKSRAATAICSVCKAVGTDVSQSTNATISPLLANLHDNKTIVRTSSLQALSAWVRDRNGEISSPALVSVLEKIPASLKQLPGRHSILQWCAEHLQQATHTEQLQAACSHLAKPLVGCMNDRRIETRTAATACISQLVANGALARIRKAVQDLPQAQNLNIQSALEKAIGNAAVVEPESTTERPVKPPSVPRSLKTVRVRRPRETESTISGKHNPNSNRISHSRGRSGSSEQRVSRSQSRNRSAASIDSSVEESNDAYNSLTCGRKDAKIERARNMRQPFRPDEIQHVGSSSKEQQLKQEWEAANWSPSSITNLLFSDSSRNATAHKKWEEGLTALCTLIPDAEVSEDGQSAIECNLDLILKYAALRFISQKTNVIFAAQKLLHSIFVFMEANDTPISEYELECVLPSLCNQIGHNQKAIRDAFNEILSKLLRQVSKFDNNFIQSKDYGKCAIPTQNPKTKSLRSIIAVREVVIRLMREAATCTNKRSAADIVRAIATVVNWRRETATIAPEFPENVLLSKQVGGAKSLWKPVLHFIEDRSNNELRQAALELWTAAYIAYDGDDNRTLALAGKVDSINSKALDMIKERFRHSGYEPKTKPKVREQSCGSEPRRIVLTAASTSKVLESQQSQRESMASEKEADIPDFEKKADIPVSRSQSLKPSPDTKYDDHEEANGSINDDLEAHIAAVNAALNSLGRDCQSSSTAWAGNCTSPKSPELAFTGIDGYSSTPLMPPSSRKRRETGMIPSNELKAAFKASGVIHENLDESAQNSSNPTTKSLPIARKLDVGTTSPTATDCTRQAEEHFSPVPSSTVVRGTDETSHHAKDHDNTMPLWLLDELSAIREAQSLYSSALSKARQAKLDFLSQGHEPVDWSLPDGVGVVDKSHPSYSRCLGALKSLQASVENTFEVLRSKSRESGGSHDLKAGLAEDQQLQKATENSHIFIYHADRIMRTISCLLTDIFGGPLKPIFSLNSSAVSFRTEGHPDEEMAQPALSLMMSLSRHKRIAESLRSKTLNAILVEVMQRTVQGDVQTTIKEQARGVILRVSYRASPDRVVVALLDALARCGTQYGETHADQGHMYMHPTVQANFTRLLLRTVAQAAFGRDWQKAGGLTAQEVSASIWTAEPFDLLSTIDSTTHIPFQGCDVYAIIAAIDNFFEATQVSMTPSELQRRCAENGSFVHSEEAPPILAAILTLRRLVEYRIDETQQAVARIQDQRLRMTHENQEHFASLSACYKHFAKLLYPKRLDVHSLTHVKQDPIHVTSKGIFVSPDLSAEHHRVVSDYRQAILALRDAQSREDDTAKRNATRNAKNIEVAHPKLAATLHSVVSQELGDGINSMGNQPDDIRREYRQSYGSTLGSAKTLLERHRRKDTLPNQSQMNHSHNLATSKDVTVSCGPSKPTDCSNSQFENGDVENFPANGAINYSTNTKVPQYNHQSTSVNISERLKSLQLRAQQLGD